MSKQTALKNKTATAIDADEAWQQVVLRDRSAGFLYAVTTTGIYCMPGCKSRRPLKSSVRFFSSAAEAERAGFRPCRKCRPEAARGNPIDKIRARIETNLDRNVRLDELGRLVGMSPFTVQRIFKKELGVSPLQYRRALRGVGLRSALKRGESVTNAIYEAGFGSSSRAYEGAALGMTPAKFAQGGKGEEIRFAAERTAFGWMVVGATERGMCWLALAGTKAEAEASVREEFPAAKLTRDSELAAMVEAAVAMVAGTAGNKSTAVPLDLRGTAFQLKVWQALREIPRGETKTYSQLARELGDANKTRAVARACALNRVSVMVPCHRVVGVSGSLTGYRWGVERKQALLAAERTR